MLKLGRNDPCWCGSGRKYKQCHEAFDQKIWQYKRQGHEVPRRDLLKTPAQVEKIRASAQVNMAALDYVAEHIRAGVTTQEIDDWVYRVTTEMGAIPAPLNYEGFPKSVCTSVNDVVCHGIPDANEVLKDGDIINVDCSTILDGYFSDSSRMFCIGQVSPEREQLVRVVKESVQKGLEAVKPWGFLGDMSQAVHDYVHQYGYHVVREIGGHGVGLEFHEDPWVGYCGVRGTGMLLVPGLMFTIEPMVNAGGPDVWVDEGNGWTVRTEDGSDSAQWEIQILVTEDGAEVISR